MENKLLFKKVKSNFSIQDPAPTIRSLDALWNSLDIGKKYSITKWTWTNQLRRVIKIVRSQVVINEIEENIIYYYQEGTISPNQEGEMDPFWWDED